MRVLHVELGRHLYGGARQVAYLLNNIPAECHEHCLVVCEGAALIQAIYNPRINVIPLPFSGDIDLCFVFRMFNVIRDVKPSLLHIHSRRGEILASFSGSISGIPMVLTRRVDNPESRVLVKVKYRAYRHVITISEGIRRVLVGLGVPEEHLSCVPSAVDINIYRPTRDHAWFKQEFALPKDAVVIGMSAQLIPRKGHTVFLRSLPAVVSRQPNLRVLIFGKGPLEAMLKAQVVSMGLNPIIQFCGFRSDMARVLPCLDLLVHPAEMEGLGVALLEASACGVPIVSTHAGGIPEVVEDGMTGLLVPIGDHERLAEAIQRLLESEQLRKQFGDAGRSRVETRFSISRMVQANLAIYQRVTSDSK